MVEHEAVPPRDNPEIGHETSDVSTRAIALFAFGLLLVAVVIHFALYWLLARYTDREARRWEPTTLVERNEEPPPEPRLQVAPQADLAELRAAEERALHSYRWIDREKNIVGIPIDRAMEIIAAQGLPVRQRGTPDGKAAAGETVPEKAGR